MALQVSYSGANLYTELTVRLLNGVKSKTPRKDVIAVQAGGKAMYQDRRVEWNVAGGGDPLEKPQQYLLFLKYRPAADAYVVIKSWHIQSAVIKAAFPEDKAAASQFKSENDANW